LETLLAFDVGLKRTGVACGQSLIASARPAGQLQVVNGKFNWHEVDHLIERWQPDKIIVGDPKTDDPHLNKVINRLKSHVQQRHKIPIIDIDETLSSDAANAELDELNRSTSKNLTTQKRIELRDQLAACLLLQSYFSDT
jgi:putative Holliday junction resolvase